MGKRRSGAEGTEVKMCFLSPKRSQSYRSVVKIEILKHSRGAGVRVLLIVLRSSAPREQNAESQTHGYKLIPVVL